tara:strand:+ start:220 stop:420 length:201 start_codon:yes stop_codon:yes gene_type:complete
VSLLQKLWIAFFVIAGFIWSGSSAYDDEKIAAERYCSMVSTFEETRGEYGWPPFKPEIKCKSTERN